MIKASKLVAGAVAGLLTVGAANAQIATGNDGGLLVVVFDGARSLVQYLGSTLTQNERVDLTTSGPEAITNTFNVDLTGFNLANTQFAVVAADNVATGGSRVYTTSTNTYASTGVLGGAINQWANQVNNYIIEQFNTAGTPCFGLTVCVSTDNTNNQYWTAGGGALAAAATVGQSLVFWDIAKPSGLSNNSTAASYTVGSRTGTWTLSTSGVLTYLFPGDAGGTEVPLPAAAWLLLSGLLGVGAVGRRKVRA